MRHSMRVGVGRWTQWQFQGGAHDSGLKAQDLDEIFSDAGLSKDDQIIVYCTGGVRAAAVAEALANAGYTDVSVYTAGFSEWAGNVANAVE